MAVIPFLLNYFSKHFLKGYKIELEDPYFEEVEYAKKSFWTGSWHLVKTKKKKGVSDSIPDYDRKVLVNVRKQAYRLDMLFNLCGVRFGWLGVIGFIPVVGDIICVFLAFKILQKACKIKDGLPPMMIMQMVLNIALDFGIGLIPIVGDLVSIAYKANSRNVFILENYLNKKYKAGHKE